MISASTTDDLHIAELRPLLPPAILMEEIPVSEAGASLISQSRQEIRDVLCGQDKRLLVVLGPCSIHDTEAGLEYAQRLRGVMSDYKSDLLLVMRVYFEKPRTTVGWKGLINDPGIDGSFKINDGLRIARKFLSDVIDIGVPAGCEFLDTISPQFIADLVSWGAIGARTTESQIHRELASGLSMPVGFKNGTDGNTRIATDAIKAASQPHHFLSVTKQGLSAIVSTTGNEHCHIILRGSSSGPNYDAETIARVTGALEENNLGNGIMVDCSHGNSNKDFSRQALVAEDVANQIKDGQRAIRGVMLESNLNEGNQSKPEQYGVSITDACVSWESTISILDGLAAAVKSSR